MKKESKSSLDIDEVSLDLNNLQSSHSRFFAKLIEFENRLKLTYIEQRSMSYSVHNTLKRTVLDISPITEKFLTSFIGIYSYPNIRIFEISSISQHNLLSYIENFYKFLIESRNLFQDWMIGKIDQLCEIIAKLIYDLKYVR